MGTLNLLLLIAQVLIAITLIVFILLQHGKGADAGAAFGSGASSTVFGSRGSSNFLTKTTTALAVLFLGNSLLLGYLATGRIGVEVSKSVMDSETLVIEASPEGDVEGNDTPQDIPTLKASDENMMPTPTDENDKG